MYIFIYKYIHIYAYICIHIRIYVYTYMYSTCKYMYTYIYACVNIHIYVQLYKSIPPAVAFFETLLTARSSSFSMHECFRSRHFCCFGGQTRNNFCSCGKRDWPLRSIVSKSRCPSLLCSWSWVSRGLAVLGNILLLASLWFAWHAGPSDTVILATHRHFTLAATAARALGSWLCVRTERLFTCGEAERKRPFIVTKEENAATLSAPISSNYCNGHSVARSDVLGLCRPLRTRRRRCLRAHRHAPPEPRTSCHLLVPARSCREPADERWRPGRLSQNWLLYLSRIPQSSVLLDVHKTNSIPFVHHPVLWPLAHRACHSPLDLVPSPRGGGSREELENPPTDHTYWKCERMTSLYTTDRLRSNQARGRGGRGSPGCGRGQHAATPGWRRFLGAHPPHRRCFRRVLAGRLQEEPLEKNNQPNHFELP